jgi:hypothetical protein
MYENNQKSGMKKQNFLNHRSPMNRWEYDFLLAVQYKGIMR